ncbi:MAG: fibronectin type III domain-containing protein [Gemmatimonadota bacterium]|nr:fibronectin type III domain-containing protein [Gemmatimonadota bacterium]
MTVRVGASVALSLNSAGDDNTYHNGDTIQVTAAFGESVTVTGTPHIAMTVGSNTRHANYRRGSPGQSLVFSYVVQTADVDPDGIEIAANALALNGGTINLTTNTATAANRDHEAVAASTSHKVDGAAASISSVAFTNQPTGTYRTIGGDIEVTVTFDRPVTVTGTPRIPLSPAFGPSNAVRFADYDSGTGTKNLVFKYTLVEGDNSDGTQASVAANALELNGGTIRTGTEDAALAHVQVSSGKTVSAKRPRINAITASPGPGVDRDLNGAADTYVGGSDINVTVGFDQNIDVDRMGQDSHVQIVLTIGTTDYALAYSGRSGSAGITFAGHTVDTTDRDDDGITLKRQSATNHVIRLSGTPSAATIKSVASLGGNDADLTLAADPKVTWTPAGENPVTSLNVRGTNAAPTSSASRVATATDTDYTFRVADFTFSDSESDPLKEVQIVSLPTSGQGALTLSGTAVTAGQTVSRSDITNLVFDPVATFEGDASFTFKAVDSFGAASAAAATMTVAVGASVSLSFNSAGADNAYHTNDAIEITAMFGESVTVGTTGGRPRIPFTIGTTVRHAVYASGSGSTALVFSYTVVAADLDADGIEVAENALELNSGTINLTSNTATAAALDHAAVPANAARKVNVAKPAAPAAPSVSTTDGTTLTVTWTAPANTRPDITDYDVEYRRKNVPGGDPTDWTDIDADTGYLVGSLDVTGFCGRIPAV